MVKWTVRSTGQEVDIDDFKKDLTEERLSNKQLADKYSVRYPSPLTRPPRCRTSMLIVVTPSPPPPRS